MYAKRKFAVLASASLLSLGVAAQDTATRGSGQQPDTRASTTDIEQVIADWKSKPRDVARTMLKKYGAPQEITEQRLVWHNNGPWKRTELINEEIDHRFPLPHKDMLLQVVNYQVPPDRFDELAQYDGSVIAERTRGELAARCDKEAANILALNLAHEIASGDRSVEDAKKAYTEQIIAMAKGEPAPLTQKLNFQPMPDAGDPDQMTMAQATADQVKQLMKQKEQQKQKEQPEK